KIDFRDVIETHLAKKAAVTMVTTKVPKNENASRFGVVKVNKNGQITNFEYKPDKPRSDLITTEIFVYDAKILLETLDELAAENDDIKDYGDELIPKLVGQKKAFEHRYKDYWRDVGTIKSYWQTQIDLLDENISFSLDDEDWAILTQAKQSVPAFIYKNADVKNSLVSQGCKIYGKVGHSILSTNVTIEKGAEVKDSVLLPGSVVDENIKIEKVIVDSDAHVTKHKAETLKKMRKKFKNDIFIIGKYKVQAESEIEE
ncbi:MAG: glucose-1-phosphate adenylyltransferase family protein, partial [Aridibacter sp.]